MQARPVIVGGHQTDFSKNWSRAGADPTALLREVLPAALEEAGLAEAALAELVRDDRIAAFVGNFSGQQFFAQGHLGAFVADALPALEGIAAARYEAACASGSVALNAACASLMSGACDVALVVGIEIMRTEDAETINRHLASAAHARDEALDVPYFFPRTFGRITDFLLEKESLEERSLLAGLAAIADKNWQHAKLNPNAQTRAWQLGDDAFREREAAFSAQLGPRTRLRDCSQVTDGAAALVLVHPDALGDRVRPPGPTSQIASQAICVGPVRMGDKLARASGQADAFPWTRLAIERAHQRAGLRVGDADVVELHDCFTVTEYLMMSMVGACAVGGELEALERGITRRGGAHPINPSGGLLGGGHPVGATGVRMVLDLHRQVTGQAGDLQIDGATTGCAVNIGGNLTTNACTIVTASAC